MDHVALIARELGLEEYRVRAALELFQQGSTVPFVARYRKERTGELDETRLREIQHRSKVLQELDERRAAILRSVEEQGKLDETLRAAFLAASTRAELEDLYLPYKPRRRTRAMAAREAGLEPLARILVERQSDNRVQPEEFAVPWVSEEKGVPDAAAAVRMACDILAEELAETPEVRGRLRELCWNRGFLVSRVRKEHEGRRTKFETWNDFREGLSRLRSHQVLALRRGEKEEILRISMDIDEESVLALLEPKLATSPTTPVGMVLVATVRDAWERLLQPSLETEIRNELRERAEAEAFRVFGRNLSDLLMAPPAGPRVTLGVDPGFRSGQKLAVVHPTGRLLEHATVHALEPENRFEEATVVILALCQRHRPELIAVGNGTGGREMEGFLRKVVREIPEKSGVPRPHIVMVSEAGASVYSASPLAVKEFPDLDVTVRGAVSIARRLQDPLAELVRIDPKSIGVGQYQHDVNQGDLRSCLEETVESCVNQVGVFLNQASEPLLAQVSGLNKAVARSIVQLRDTRGPFASRQELLQVPGFGPKTFEQAAGFLRIPGGSHPLDASGVHPERYPLVERMARDLEMEVSDLVGHPEVVARIDPARYIDEEIGLPTLRDILLELEKPARDPRAEFSWASFREDVRELKDLTPGMELEGVVTNVTDFGAFVDVGVHQDGLVHISRLASRFVRDPREVVAVGQVVKVRVLEVDSQTRRVALTMKPVGQDDAEDSSSGRFGRRAETRSTPQEMGPDGRPVVPARRERAPLEHGRRERAPAPPADGQHPEARKPQRRDDRPRRPRNEIAQPTGPAPESSELRRDGTARSQRPEGHSDRRSDPREVRERGRPSEAPRGERSERGGDPQRQERVPPEGQGNRKPRDGSQGPKERQEAGPREWVERPRREENRGTKATIESLVAHFKGEGERKQSNTPLQISLKQLMRSGR